jgi:hypothetical protein
MRPRYFWYLVDAQGEKKPAKRGLSKAEKKRLLRWIEEENGGS